MTDYLKINHINNLPQPLFVRVSGMEWPVHDIDVESGLMRIDVNGMIQVVHVASVSYLRDADGVRHEIESICNDSAK